MVDVVITRSPRHGVRSHVGRTRIVEPMARRVTSPELVGRTAAVDQMMDILASARDGMPRHVLVIGEAGVGKTRLLARTRELAEADGVRALLAVA